MQLLTCQQDGARKEQVTKAAPGSLPAETCWRCLLYLLLCGRLRAQGVCMPVLHVYHTFARCMYTELESIRAVVFLAALQAYINLDDSILQRVKLLVPEQYEKPADVLRVRALLV